MLLGGWVYIRFFGCCGLGFRPYGGSLFPDAEKVTKKACSYVRPARWGSGFLHYGIDPGGIAYGLLRCTYSRCVRLRRTSLRSFPRINPSAQPSDVARGSKSKAGELTLGLLSGEELGALGFGFVVFLPLIGTPPAQPCPEGEGAGFWAFQNVSSARHCTSACLSQTPRSAPSPSGSVCTGDMVDTCSETWWTVFGLFRM